jgi:DNA helicase HerA-like ATPase
MYKDGKLLIAKSDEKELFIIPRMANRHGLIAGATGTGKTITMKVIAESFSDMGVPVFFSDVKGDLTGMIAPGRDSEDMQRRIEYFGIGDTFRYRSYPTRFWDIFGETGHPVRVTVSEMGPQLLARLFNLTEIQAGVLSIVFKVADEHGLLLLDLKDLRAMLKYVGDNRQEFTTTYGNVSSASIGAIQRALLAFEDEGGELVFGEPELDIRDWMRTDADGRGYINILSSKRLITSPKVYATFLLWMLNELFEKLPEVGDLDKPRMIFFFDEAHMLFEDAPRALVSKIVQVVKLIRSKGVGVYFVTQSPSDIPDEVLAQLSNRVQHGLRAYTPAEQKTVRAAARSFRKNEAFDTEEVLMALGTGEALVSFLDEKGIPSIVEKARVLPPQSLIGAADSAQVEQTILTSEFELKYREQVDRESAYEIIMEANKKLEEEKAEELAQKEKEKEEKKAVKKTASGKSRKAGTVERAANAAASSAARSVSTNLVNSVLGGKVTSAGTIGKRAASSALSSVMRSGVRAILRGLFGLKK